MNDKICPNRTKSGLSFGRAGLLLEFVFIVSSLVLLSLDRRGEAKRFAMHEEIVSRVKQGKLRANSSGDILLPKPWASLTKNGHVYQTFDKEAGLVLLFPTNVEESLVDWENGKIEKEWNIAGNVYCSGPLPGDKCFSFIGMNVVCTWNEKPVRPHWYYVEPFYSD